MGYSAEFRRRAREQRRAQWAEQTSLADTLNGRWDAARDAAERSGEVEARPQRAHLLHLLLCLVTGGLWLPVYGWLLWSDHRRFAGSDAAARERATGRAAWDEMVADQQAARRAQAKAEWAEVGRRVVGRR